VEVTPNNRIKRIIVKEKLTLRGVRCITVCNFEKLSALSPNFVSESDFMPTRALLSGFAFPYYFSISLTFGLAFGQCMNMFS